MNRFLIAAFAGAMTFAAHAHDSHVGAQPDFTSLPQGNELATGEIHQIEREASAIAIKHGPLPQFDMPPMIMEFHVSHPVMLELVQPGDRIGFRAEESDGHFTVTEIRPAGM